MAHGAPDHTRLSDDAFSHYALRYERWTVWPHQVVVTDFINRDFVGVFGYLAMCFDDPQVEVKIYVDGVHIGTFRIDDFRGYFGEGFQNGNAWVTVPVYDITTNYYTLIIDYRWHVYVHKNLTITTQSTAGGVHGTHDIRLLYKEKV